MVKLDLCQISGIPMAWWQWASWQLLFGGIPTNPIERIIGISCSNIGIWLNMRSIETCEYIWVDWKVKIVKHVPNPATKLVCISKSPETHPKLIRKSPETITRKNDENRHQKTTKPTESRGTELFMPAIPRSQSGRSKLNPPTFSSSNRWENWIKTCHPHRLHVYMYGVFTYMTGWFLEAMLI